MNRFIDLSEFDLNLIADLLANSHDWNVLDIEGEFVDLLMSEGVSINRETALFIYQRWEQIPLQDKFTPYFNARIFLSRLLETKN